MAPGSRGPGPPVRHTHRRQLASACDGQRRHQQRRPDQEPALQCHGGDVRPERHRRRRAVLEAADPDRLYDRAAFAALCEL